MQGPSMPPTPVSTREHFLVCLNRLCVCVCMPSGHVKIAQNIQSPETGNPPSLPLPVSVFSWVGTGALLTSGKRMQEAFQMPAVSLRVQPPAGKEGGFPSLRSWDFLGQQGVHWSMSPSQEGVNPFGI